MYDKHDHMIKHYCVQHKFTDIVSIEREQEGIENEQFINKANRTCVNVSSN